MENLHVWHQRKRGLLIFGLVELALVYAFASLAIARGNLWYYGLALLFLIGGIQNLFKLIGNVIHGGREKSKA
jgi:hypothetical protein